MANEHIEKLEPREYMRRYLKVAPLSLAVFRSIEAKNIGKVAMARPILDVGCGFGEFAGVFFDSKVEMGLDISWKELVNAKKSNKYKKLAWVDARDMPFESNYFGTVLSVSVLEHVEEVEGAIAEIYRVLQPGKKFIFTVNTNKINKHLFWPKFLKDLGYPQLAEKYLEKYHRVFSHKTLWDADKWKECLEKMDFKIEEMREIISPEATRVFELFILTSWPSQLFKILFGKRWAWRPRWFREWLVRRYGWLVEQEEKEGSNLFCVAVKPS
jgi:SAM-dependent methyltransferase